MNGIQRVIRDEPTIIIDAVRMTLFAVVLLGLDLTDEQVVGVVIAFSSLLTVANRAIVTPAATVEARVEQAVEDALTAEAEPLTPEQQAVLADLRAIRDSLRTRTGRTPA